MQVKPSAAVGQTLTWVLSHVLDMWKQAPSLALQLMLSQASLKNRIPDSPVFPFLSGKRGISRFPIGRE
jgi:hypothetical protein